jgi:hypothetical protein
MQGRQKTPEEISAEAAANTAHNRQLLLFKVDHNVRKQKVCPHVPIDMLGLFAQTCQHAEADTAFLRLMTAAVEAEPMSYNQEDETSLAAIAILKRHPELLFVKGMVTDHFGRKIFASPYQLFHGAGDVWALKQIHEEIIPKIENGEASAQEQFHQQFPNCKLPFEASMGEEALYDDRNIAQVAQVKENLKSIIAVITADPCTNGLATLDATKVAIAELCQLFAPKEGEVIRTGLHFPLAIMQEIFRVYDAQYDPWNYEQLSFFSREVIGAALAASTAVDGQCCKHGLSKLDVKNGPDRRDGLFCRRPKGIPQELAPLRGKLGRTMFVDPYDGESVFLSSKPGLFDWYNKNGGEFVVAAACRRAAEGHASVCGRAMLENLCRAKTSDLQNLCGHSEKRRRLGV